MSPVITFGGLLGEATEGRIVSTKIGSGQALSSSEASVSVHLSHYLYFHLKSLLTYSMINLSQSRLPSKGNCYGKHGEANEQEKMHSCGKKKK